MNPEKSFLEVSFPLKETSEESSREKNIRHGHISTLHIWWTRRPLASSRATVYASLTPIKGRKRKVEGILRTNGDKTLRVLDPFSGGGSIPKAKHFQKQACGGCKKVRRVDP